MQREIKFRAWLIQEKKMGSVSGISFRGTGNEIGIHEDPLHRYTDENLDFILMQYTGSKDENGKKIYEGDIVLTRNLNKAVIKSTEKQRIGMLNSFRVVLSGKNQFPIDTLNDCFVSCVIGNIYENPDLLED